MTQQTKLTPRPYQKKALRAMADALVVKRKTDAGIVVLPTGAGKTFTASYFNNECIKQLGGAKIIWVVHRDELIKQAMEAHELVCDPSVKMTEWTSNKKNATGDIIFVSIQSSRGLAENLEGIYGTGKGKFILAIDEAHHYAAKDNEKGYSNMYANLDEALRVSGLLCFAYGLTATPERLDGKKLGFSNVIYQMKFMDGVREGFLARPVMYEMRTHQQFKLDSTQRENGKKEYTDQDLKQLDNPIRNRKIAEEVVRHLQWRCDKQGQPILDENGNKKHGWGKTLVFAVNVNHCYALAKEMKEIDPNCDVKVVTGATSDEERKQFKEWLAAGDMHTPKVAINCLVFTEGFDEPTINTIFLTRPTKSEVLWMQMVGRGARVIKDKATGQVIKDKFNLVSVMDEIGKYNALVKDWTLSLMSDNPTKVEAVKKQRKKQVRAKRKLILKTFEHEGIKFDTLSDAEIVDTQAILVCSTKYGETQGIPVDQDRIDCIRMLKAYLEKCFTETTNRDGSINVTLDMDAFRNSYSHCVSANEFDHETWRHVMWAYYLHFVRNQKFIRNAITGQYQPTWKLIPMVAREKIDSDEAVLAAEQRLADTEKHVAEKNEAFNLKYGGRTASRKLYEHILNKFSSHGNPEDALFCTEHAIRIIAKDRRIEVKLKIQVGEKTKDAKRVFTINRKCSELLQNYLQDSAAEFRVVPAVSNA